MPSRGPYSEPAYTRFYRELKRAWHPCHYPGCGQRGISPDHVPPLSRHRHVAGTGCCYLLPSCRAHQAMQRYQLAVGLDRDCYDGGRLVHVSAEVAGGGQVEVLWRTERGRDLFTVDDWERFVVGGVQTRHLPLVDMVTRQPHVAAGLQLLAHQRPGMAVGWDGAEWYVPEPVP